MRGEGARVISIHWGEGLEVVTHLCIFFYSCLVLKDSPFHFLYHILGI